MQISLKSCKERVNVEFNVKNTLLVRAFSSSAVDEIALSILPSSSRATSLTYAKCAPSHTFARKAFHGRNG